MSNLDYRKAAEGAFGKRGPIRDAATAMFGIHDYNKATSVFEESSKKMYDLAEKSRAKRALMEARDAETVINKLGLENDSLAGFGVNAVVGFGNAVSQLTGRVASGVHDARGTAYSRALDDTVLSARQRELAGTATPEDIALLNRPQGRLQDTPAVDPATLQNLPVAAQRIINRTGGPTNRDLVQKMEGAQKDAQLLRETFDFSKRVHQGNKDALVADLKSGAADDLRRMERGYEAFKNGEVLSGLGDMASGFVNTTGNIVSAAASNPLGLADFTIDSAPQMLAAAAGTPIAIGASALYGLDNYGKGLQAYSKNNGGAIAPSDERTRMGILAAASAGAEYVGNAAMGLNRFVKGSAKAADDLAVEAVQGVSRSGLKDALRKASDVATKNPVSQWAGGIVKGAAGEYPTEGFQTWAENSITGDSTSLEDIYVGAAIGAASGGLMSSGAPIVGAGLAVEGTKALAKGAMALPGMVSSTKEKLETGKAQQEAFDVATKTGNVDALLDNQTAAYSPSKALTALHDFNQLDTTDNDTRDANVVKGAELLSTMEADLQTLKAQTPQGKQEIKQDLDALKARMASTDPADTQTLEGLNQSATKLEELLAAPLAQGEEAKKVSQKIQAQVQEIESATELHGKMADHALQKLIESLDLDAELAVADAPVDMNDAPAVEQANVAAQKLITLSMVHRDKVTSEQAAQLANNTSNGLSEPVRSYFRAFSEAQQAENDAKNLDLVSKEVLYGDAAKDQMGIQTYRERISTALASGNKKVADRTLSLLDNFVSSHNGKEGFAQEALAKANEEGQRVSVARTKQGTWEILPVPFQTEKARKENGGFDINPGKRSLGFIAAIEAEANALRTAQTELQAAYALKFNPTSATATPVAPATTTTAAATSAVPVTQPAQPVATGTGSGVSQTPQVAPTTPVTSTATTEEITNGTQTPEAVQTEEKGPQASADTGTAGSTAVTQSDQTVNQPESPEGVSAVEAAQTEGNVDQINTSEGNVENTAENVQVQQETEEKPDARLSAFADTPAEGATFKQRNLIASDLKQSAGGEDVVTPRPLAAVKDFLSQWFDKKHDILKEYLGKDWAELSEKQQDLLLAFRDKAAKWAPLFQASVGLKAANDKDDKWLFRFQDMMQFLIQSTDVDGKAVHALEENVKTAMSYAAYSWIAEQASRAAFNGPEEINAILGRDEDHDVSEFEESKLANVGTRRNVVANSLGQRAVAALGISAQKTANKDTLTKLEGAMGTHIMRVLLSNGMLEQTTVDAATMAQLRGDKSVEVNANHDFLKLKRDVAGELTNDAKSIYTSVVGTQGILDDLLSVESGLKEPSLLPIPYKQRTTKNTDQRVPERLAMVLEKENSEASYVKEDHWVLWNSLDEAVLHEMAGAKEVSNDKTHKSKRLSIEAKNDGLLREIQRFHDFVSAAIEPLGKRINEVPMFFEHVAWKQQRVGIATNMVNPQTSKVQRFMLFRKSWETQVDPNNSKQMENFKLRVLEGFGVKTDRMSSAKALKENWSKTQTPTIQAAVQAIMNNAIDGVEMTAEMQQTILDGVKEAGEKFHSLDSLIALARYQHAAGQPFTVHMMGEIDGVTNGPMLTHLLLGAANSAKELFARINKGGFFQKGNEHSQYNIWRGQPGQKDLYESTIEVVIGNVIDRIGSNPKLTFVWDAVWKFTGDLRQTDDKMLKKRRDIIKTPLTAVMFGSSLNRAVESMAEKFVETVYDGIEKLASMKEGDPATEAARLDAIKQINILIGKDAPKWRTNMTIQQMLDTEFSVDQLKGIKGTFSRTMGSSVKGAMKAEFKALLDRRDQLNKTAQLAFTVYDATYKAMRADYVRKVMKEGEDTNSKGEALHDLTAEQEAEVRKQLNKMFPSLQSLMSLDSEQLSAGLGMMKSKRKLSDKRAYQSEVVQGSLPGLENKKTAKVNGYEVVNEAPGVGMVPMSIHSLDSAISHYAAMMSEVLNVHDAHGTGLGNFFTAARNLNHSTWNALLNYSPAEQMYQGLERTIKGFAEVLSKEGTPTTVALAVKQQVEAMMDKSGFDGSVEDYLAEALTNTKLTAYNADRIKLEAMTQLQSVDQYALEGGNYTVTEKDQAEAQKKLDALEGTVSQETMALVKQIGAAMQQLEGMEFPADGEVEQDLDPDLEEAAEPTSPWGDLGESTIASDPELVALMEKTGEVTAAQAIDFLNKRFQTGKQTRMNQFNRRLLSVLFKTVGKDLKIKYITPQTATSEVLKKADFSRGWYVPNGDKSEIYVLSPEHLYSGLTAETLLHEMTHAALFHVMNTASTPETKELIQELEDLRTKATEFIQKKGLTKHADAVENIHDFVAWGMTNQAFQRDVLGKITMQSKTRKNALVTGMKKFIDALVGLLFKDSDKSRQAIAVNGMTVLINNTAGLFAAAANETQAGTSTTVLSQKHVDPANKANTYSTEDIYNALDNGSVSPEFSGQLKELLNGIVEKLHGPFGSLKAKLMENSTLDPLEVWAKAVQTGKVPFASEALTAGFNISEQEAFVLEQVEATVKAAMTDNAGQTTAVYSELRKLYAEAARKLKPTDFADPALYDFLFKVEAGGNNQSDYLSRFAALGLTHEGVSKLLQFSTDRDTRSLMDVPTMLGKLKFLFEKALNLLNGKLTHTTEGMQADDKLKTLVEQLVEIEAKKRRKLAQQDKNFLSPIGDLANDVADGVRSKVTDLAQSGFVKNSKNGFVKLAGAVVTISANGQVGMVLKGIQKMRDEHLKEKNGLVMGLVNDVRGPKAWLEQLLRMRKKQEQDRKFVITETAKAVMDSFTKEAGKDLTTDEKKAITSVFLRTGMHSLMEQYDMSEIQQLLEDRAELQKAIAFHESQLSQFPEFQHYFSHQAKVLAYHRTNGWVKGTMLMMNAGNIARLYGTKHAGKLSEAQTNEAEGIIDSLTTLYALQYTDGKHLSNAKQVMRNEMNRTDGGNGVETVLKLHKELENEARATLFAGNEALMMKGHTPEIYNPHTDVKIATSPEELKELKRLGYTNEGELKQDNADEVLPGGWVMVLRDGGMQPWQTGVVSYRGRQAKGSKLHSGYTNPFDDAGLQNANTMSDVAQAKQAEIDQMFKPNPGFNPALEKRNFMAPVLNRDGQVTNWRYMMNDKLKDVALERDSRVDQVLGALAGSTFDKQTANEVNVQVVQALKEHYNKEFKHSPNSFAKISHDSTDPEMRELYAMLPKETRQAIRTTWGKDGMHVPYEMLDVVFGYRKATLSSIWEKDKRNMMENALVMAVETMLYQYGRHRKGMSSDEAEEYSKRGAVTMRRAENIWQEIVRETKDTIVVKTGTVLFDNIVSNMSLLTIHGVSPLDMVRHHRVAFKAARAYQHDKSMVFHLQQKIDLGLLSPEEEAKARTEIIKLEDAIARNPVLPLIEEGLMPTIVEDVAADDDIYSYKSQLSRKLSKYESKVNPMVASVARGIYMAHDTGAYQFLYQATQLSDFVARYTLYQHLTTKKDKPMSHRDAVRQASESFINYDVPMHKSMQYLDDMGIVPFMKYALRIQRVLVRLTKENPARVLSMVLLNNMFDALPLVTDSGMLSRIGNNPLQWGAFKYPTTLDNLATVNAAMGLMR